jgi:hypothetical protein
MIVIVGLVALTERGLFSRTIIELILNTFTTNFFSFVLEGWGQNNQCFWCCRLRVKPKSDTFFSGGEVGLTFNKRVGAKPVSRSTVPRNHMTLPVYFTVPPYYLLNYG